MTAPKAKPLPEDAIPLDDVEKVADSVARPAGARSDLAVVAELLPYLRSHVGRIVLSLALILCAKLANMLVPIALKRIVDDLGLEPSLRTVPIALLLAYRARDPDGHRGTRLGVRLELRGDHARDA